MKSVFCLGCRGWFNAKLHRCDKCGLLRPTHNVALLGQRATNWANDRKASAIAEDTF